MNFKDMAKIRPNYVRLYIPKNVDRYKARKIQNILLLLDKQLKEDVSKVNFKDYIMILDAYSKLTSNIRKELICNGISKKIKPRVDSQRVDEKDAGQKDEDVFSN